MGNLDVLMKDISYDPKQYIVLHGTMVRGAEVVPSTLADRRQGRLDYLATIPATTWLQRKILP